MSEYRSPPDLVSTIQQLKAKVQELTNAQPVQVYTMATRPPAGNATLGTIIYVSDAPAGFTPFQGWNGTGWINIG